MAGLRSRRAGTIFGRSGQHRVIEHRGDNPVVGWRHWINHRIIIRCSTSNGDDGVPDVAALGGRSLPALQQQGADSPGGAVAAQGYGAVHGIFFAVEDDDLRAVAFGEGFKVGPVN